MTRQRRLHLAAIVSELSGFAGSEETSQKLLNVLQDLAADVEICASENGGNGDVLRFDTPKQKQAYDQLETIIDQLERRV